MPTDFLELLPPGYARLYAATDRIVIAAGLVVDCWQKTRYTPGLVNGLRQLDAAVREWRGSIHALSLDSDTNGFDRSERMHDGNRTNESGTLQTGGKKGSSEAAAKETGSAG